MFGIGFDTRITVTNTLTPTPNPEFILHAEVVANMLDFLRYDKTLAMCRLYPSPMGWLYGAKHEKLRRSTLTLTMFS